MAAVAKLSTRTATYLPSIVVPFRRADLHTGEYSRAEGGRQADGIRKKCKPVESQRLPQGGIEAQRASEGVSLKARMVTPSLAPRASIALITNRTPRKCSQGMRRPEVYQEERMTGNSL